MNTFSSSKGLSRRRFLQNSAAATTAAIAFPAVVKSASPNSTLQVACIGVGGMGASTMRNVASHKKVRIVSLCDVDKGTLDDTAKKYPGVSTHADWREMLNDHADKFDAVTIGTPDHAHAGPAVIAMRANKHVYLQKPMAPTPHECRVIAREAKRADVVTQLGNQGRSSVESRMAVQLLKEGAIGKVKEVIIWENKRLSWWPSNTNISGRGEPIPSGLSWDLWLDCREPRPWFSNTYHPKNWRAWFDFGVGEMGDMGCHHFDPTFDALNLTAPIKVRQLNEGSSGALWGKHHQVELIFPGTDMTAGDTLKVTWQDGDIRPDASRIPLPKDVKELPESGSCWIGENGHMFKNYRKGAPVVLPESDFPQSRYPTDIAPQNHYHDWVDAILKGTKSCADFSHGGPLTETVLIGALSDRFPKQWLEWDSKKVRFTNNKEANKLVRRAYREGWKVKGLG